MRALLVIALLFILPACAGLPSEGKQNWVKANTSPQEHEAAWSGCVNHHVWHKGATEGALEHANMAPALQLPSGIVSRNKALPGPPILASTAV
jgi:hypothetical protein